MSVRVCEGEIEGEREIERMGEREREEIEREKLQVDGSNKDKRRVESSMDEQMCYVLT